MRKVELESNWVYGPVKSRRYGNDTGINLLPLNKKTCTFDCLYCQFGFTPPGRQAGAEEFPSPDQIISQLNLHRKKYPIDHITIAGNGEPTMHPRFEEIAQEILDWRNAHCENVPIAIFTNGFRLTNPKIMSLVRQFDEPVVKLDAGDPRTVSKLDRPAAGFDFYNLVDSLRKCPGILIQSMFIAGWNDSSSDFHNWIQVLATIQPASVQMYTIDRVPAFQGLKPVSHKWLSEKSRLASQILKFPVRSFC